MSSVHFRVVKNMNGKQKRMLKKKKKKKKKINKASLLIFYKRIETSNAPL
jgi:hypothetical protein